MLFIRLLINVDLFSSFLYSNNILQTTVKHNCSPSLVFFLANAVIELLPNLFENMVWKFLLIWHFMWLIDTIRIGIYVKIAMWISCNQSNADKKTCIIWRGIFRFRISACSLCTLQSNANREAVSLNLSFKENKLMIAQIQKIRHERRGLYKLQGCWLEQ